MWLMGYQLNVMFPGSKATKNDLYCAQGYCHSVRIFEGIRTGNIMQIIRQSFVYCVSIILCALVLWVPSGADDGNKYNCKLNASSPFSWVVMIWDNNKDAKSGDDGAPGTATMGSLITCNAVLTTAYYYNTRVLNNPLTFTRVGGYKRFKVIAQYIYDRRSGQGRLHPCYQNESVSRIDFHPKSKIDGERILFDFAVVVMPKPFGVISPTFPTMFFPSSTLELILAIRYVNIIQSETYCAIPTPENFNVRDWIWYEKLDVRSKPFHSQCARVLCEQRQAGGGSVERPQCEIKLNQRMNATMLCMIPNWERRLGFPPNKDGSLYPNLLAGSPLVCNGSTLGMSNFVKTRGREGYPDYAQDIFFTITLLRVLPWLIQEIKTHTPPIQPFYIEDKGLARVNIPEPSRLTTEDWGRKRFFSLPAVDKPFATPFTDNRKRSPAPSCWSSFAKTLLALILLPLKFSL